MIGARSVVRAVSHTALAGALVPVGYYALFSTFRDWDDEGYFALTLRAFVDGKPLYDDVYTQYGPFYYELFGGMGRAFDLPFTTDSVRFLTLATWILAAILVGVATTRVTGWLVVGLAAQIVAFATCGELVNTPMHPTGLILVLLGVVAVGIGALGSRRHRPAAVAIGIATAAMVLTKPNVGGFLAIGLAASCAVALARTSSRRAATVAVTTAVAAAIPVVLMRDWLSLYTTRAFVAAFVAALVAVGVQAAVGGPYGKRADIVSFLRLAAIAGAVTVVATLVAALIHGTSPGGLVRGLVLEPLELSDAYFVPVEVPFGSAALAVALSVLGIVAPLAGRRLGRRTTVTLTGLAVTVAIVGAIMLLAEHSGLFAGIKIEGKGALDALHGAGVAPWLIGGGAMVAVSLGGAMSMGSPWLHAASALGRIAVGLAGWLAIAGESELEGLMLPLSLAWLALLPPVSASVDERARFVRLLLVTTAVLQTAMVYPVGGSQARLAVLLLVVTLGIVLADGLTELRVAVGSGATWRVAVPVAAIAVAAAALARPVVLDGWSDGRAVYRSSAALSVPGSSRLRLEPELAADLAALVADVTERCSTLIGYPGFGSLHLWTGIDPVTDLNPGDWMELLGTSEQQRVVDAVTGRPRVCVVWNETVYRHWMRGRPAPDGPLVEYTKGFGTVARYGRHDVQIGMPEGRG